MLFPEQAVALAVTLLLLLLQVIGPLLETKSVGRHVSADITVVAVAVQPLPDCVTVTVNVAAVVVVNVEPLPNGVQLYEVIVFPEHAVPDAVTVRGELAQVKGPLFEAVTVGLQVSTVKVVEPLAVQPLPDCVTVTE